MRLTKNFSLSEFACKDGSPVPDSLLNNVSLLAENLQVLRDHFRSSITINSSYRTKSHNRSVGGSSNSQHLTASAADIVVAGVPPSQVQESIEKLIESGRMKQGGLGIYRTFTHYDIRASKARW